VNKADLKALLDQVVSDLVPPSEAVSLWSRKDGSISVGTAGYRAITSAAEMLKSDSAWSTYPHGYLMRVATDALIDSRGDTAVALDAIEAKLNSSLGHQRAYVPFWGFHLCDGLELDFGPYKLAQIGEGRYDSEILGHVRLIYNGQGEEKIREVVGYAKQDTSHIANVPVLIFEYDGGGEGARDIVDPIAEHVGEFMQFAIGAFTKREEVKIVDHRGDYFGRFTNIMPVVSDEPVLYTPNLRRSPYGGLLGTEHADFLKNLGILDLLPKVPAGPSEGNDVDDMLLRAIQMIADGERATSQRLAMVGYVGACDTLFGKRDDAQRYTCTGMAVAMGGDFAANYDLALQQYDRRSRSAHQGFSPEELLPARRFAYASVVYVSERKATLTNKKAIRAHVEPHVPAK
jgi:hypothetical protein